MFCLKQIYCGSIIALLITQTVSIDGFILGAWVPYWRPSQSIESAKNHISMLSQISPFSYEVDDQGNLRDPFKRRRTDWISFFDYCRGKKIKIIPTIFWTKTSAMHNCLAYKKNRAEHVRQIVDVVTKEKFDGININYERVNPEDRHCFIAFMRSLSNKLHARNLLLCCCMGGRTSDTSVSILRSENTEDKPADKPFIGFSWAREKDKPENKKTLSAPTVSLDPGQGSAAIRYKKSIANYCDQIHVMGYDEWGLPCKYDCADLKTCYYVSHCSNMWTEQIIQYSLSFIPADKLILGIPTYGLEFSVLKENDDLIFKKVRNVIFPRACELLKKHKKRPVRSSGDELTFTYTDNDELRYVCYPDGQSIANRIAIARKYGLKGAYIFKIDGLDDKKMLGLIKDHELLKLKS